MDSNLLISWNREHFSLQNLVVNPRATLASITSGCILILLEHQRLVLEKVLKIQMTGMMLTRYRATFCSPKTEPRSPETSCDPEGGGDAIGRIDLRNVKDVKLVQRGGKGKKGGKGGNAGNGKENGNADEEKAAQRRREEEERLKKWNDDWDKKLKAQEALDDVACCSANGLCLKPKTQSNIWIKVTQNKTTQDIQMAFMHVPVPKPKPPPLPKLVNVEAEISETPVQETESKGGKKKTKGKKK